MTPATPIDRSRIDHRPPPALATAMRAGLVAAAVLFGAGCPRGGDARGPAIAADGWALGGEAVGGERPGAVALAGDDVVVASETEGGARVRRLGPDGAVQWTRDLPARPRALAVGPADTVAVVLEGEADAAAIAAAGLTGLPDGLRGQPGAAVVLLGPDGAPRATFGVGSTRWVTVRALAFDGDAVLVGGAFTGTLRVGEQVVTAGGAADGFWARIDPGGRVSLRRLGGDRFDTVTGVAPLTDGRLAIAGTFTGTADVGDFQLDSPTQDAVAGDGFVVVLDRGGAVAWARTWGGELEDTGAGLAALSGGGLVVAGTVSGDVEVAGRKLSSAGTTDGVVVFLGGDGAVRAAHLLGGADVDTLTGVAASPAGDRAVVTGRFNGTLYTRAGAVGSPAADAAFVAVLDRGAILAAAAVVSEAATVDTLVTADARGWLLAAHASAPLGFLAATFPAGPALLRRPW